jgi:hypothetical protein
VFQIRLRERIDMRVWGKLILNVDVFSDFAQMCAVTAV